MSSETDASGLEYLASLKGLSVLIAVIVGTLLFLFEKMVLGGSVSDAGGESEL